MDSLYNTLSNEYDKINSEINFKEWFEAVKTYLKEQNFDAKSMVDIGCGTGSFCLEAALQNVKCFGIDISPEMLDIASSKTHDLGLDKRVEFSCQDMTIFELEEPVDFAVCTLDGINHLSSKNKVQFCFDSVANALSDGGYFFFDLNSKYKFENVYGNNTYTYDLKNKFIIWQNNYHSSTKTCYFMITSFDKIKKDTYKRVDSFDKEYFYSLKSIENMLNYSGFELQSVSSDYLGSKLNEKSEKIFIVAKKRK